MLGTARTFDGLAEPSAQGHASCGYALHPCASCRSRPSDASTAWHALIRERSPFGGGLSVATPLLAHAGRLRFCASEWRPIRRHCRAYPRDSNASQAHTIQAWLAYLKGDS